MTKILFVHPSTRDTMFGQMKYLDLPPMGLGILATLTPDRYEVSIVDENIDKIDFDADADLDDAVDGCEIHAVAQVQDQQRGQEHADHGA